ncbi:stomatin-2 [Trichonephila clavipes]|nr:stomatin-2 [Trichonephila clavipes]
MLRSGEPAGICDMFLIGISYLMVLCTLPLSLFFCFKVVQEYERAVIFRLGRLSKGGARGPGLFFILPCTDNYCKCDLRTVSFNVPPQEVLSKDSVTVSVDAVVYYRISDATTAVSNVANYDSSTQLLAATTLRTVLGTKSLSEILSEREHISHVMQSSLDEATAPWGIKVERVEIKDVRLPQQMQRAMAAEAEASREARAKVSDEAHFWLNGYVNKQNCRIWSEANPQVYVETPLHPEKLTVWCALWAGGIIGPYFFKNDTANGDRYRAMITNFFIPELNNHDVQELWFQQDGATCHTARDTIDLLKDTLGDRLISRFGPVNWPPRSCDLTPLDYFLWGYVKSLVYADKPQTLDHLEDNIRRVIADIRPQMLEKVIENWTSILDYIRASRARNHI